MTSVGMHEAKTRLSQLVLEVEAGGDVVITRHGRPVAKLVRIEPVDRRSGFGAMKGWGNIPEERLTLEYINASNAEVLEMFGLDDQPDE